MHAGWGAGERMVREKMAGGGQHAKTLATAYPRSPLLRQRQKRIKKKDAGVRHQHHGSCARSNREEEEEEEEAAAAAALCGPVVARRVASLRILLIFRVTS